MQVVHLHERYAGGVVYPAHNSGVVTRWKIGDDRRFAWVCRGVAAVLNILDLVVSDDAADYRLLPIIVGGDQSSVSVVEFQCWISQEIRNPVLAKLTANSTYDHVLWLGSLYDETANHYVSVSSNETTSTDIP